MKLYDIRLPARIYTDEISDGSTYIDVDHLDGMYSFGRTEKGGIIHLSAATPLERVGEEDYKIKTNEGI